MIGRHLWQNPGIREEASKLLRIAKDSHQIPACTCSEPEETFDGTLHGPKCPMVPFAKTLWMEATDRWMEMERESRETPEPEREPEGDDADL